MTIANSHLRCLLACIFLTGCNTIAPMQVSKPATYQKPAPLEAVDVHATFALTKLINDLDRGQQIFAFPGNPPTEGNMCNHTLGHLGVVTASGGKQYLGDWSSELGELFYEEFIRMGFSVAGDPDDLFTQAASVKSAEFLVGGRLTNMSGNFCMEHDPWYGLPLQTISGEMAVTLEWSVLNTLTKEVVINAETSGYHITQTPEVNGILSVFEGAFLDAVRRLGSLEDIRRIAKGEQLDQVQDVDTEARKFFIKNGNLRDNFDINFVKQFVVTIRVGQGHGSGFFIGDKGLVITNAHVIGDAKKVQVVTANGLEIQGTVVSRDKARDVALVQLPSRLSKPLGINVHDPIVSSTVFAVGTPIDESMKTTVTRGVLSAKRTDSVTGMKFLQSDAAISPGNSGGPLFDEKSQVVGIAVSKFVGGGTEGLGLFIPIKEALVALNIQIE